MIRPVHLIYLFLFALLTGFMAVVRWSLVPAQHRLPAGAYAVLEQGMNQVLETLTPARMIGALVSGLIVLVLAWRTASPTRWLQAASVLGLGVMVTSTLIINAPINSAIDTWNAAQPPADWQALRDRWEFGHMLRSYVGIGALLAALAAAIWER